MELQKNLYNKICRILTVDYTLFHQKENQKIYKAVSVLHKEYLISSAREARSIINKDTIDNKYNLMIKIYNRRIKEHQALILLIQLFEIAMRTQAAIVLSRKFSTTDDDDWYWIEHSSDQHEELKNKISNRAIAISKIVTPDMTTFDMFHMLTLSDVRGFYTSHWETSFKELFSKTTYKTNTILPFTTKNMFEASFKRINKYRNELYHGNPGSSGWRQIINDIENILVHLGYNVEDAINNIDPNHSIIRLQYTY